MKHVQFHQVVIDHPAEASSSSPHGVHSSPSVRDATLAPLCATVCMMILVCVCVSVIWCVLYLTAAWFSRVCVECLITYTFGVNMRVVVVALYFYSSLKRHAASDWSVFA